MNKKDDSVFELRPHIPFTTDDVVKELENIQTMLDNLHSDLARLGVMIFAVLLAILAVLFFKL